MAITFGVSPVQPAHRRLQDLDETTSAISRPLFLMGRPVEAWGSSPPECLRARQHGLLAAVGTAFDLHYPLTLTPDAIWLAIAQGFAAHVKVHAERLRGKFVRHDGQSEIRVGRDDFVAGSSENPWPEVLSAFSEQVAVHIGRQRDLVVCDFSTTGPCERAASEIVLLDAMSSYFRYVFSSLCGIPSITLEGTAEDYRSIRRRVQALSEYDLSWWTEALLPVIDQFVDASEGRVAVAFWRSIFKLREGSGGPFVTGWINVFFPYLLDGETLHRNTAIHKELAFTTLEERERDRAPESEVHPADDTGSRSEDDSDADEDGGVPRDHRMEEAHVPSGLSIVPFRWDYRGQRLSMELLGGFVGMAQDAHTLALRPAIGWAVRERWDSASSPDASAGSARDDEPVYVRHLRAKLEGEPVPLDGPWLIAGRASLGRALRHQDAVDVAQLLASARRRFGVELTCFTDLRREGAPMPLDPARSPGTVFMGLQFVTNRRHPFLPAAGSFREAEERLLRVPASVWRDLSAILPGGISDGIDAYLASVDARALLVFGEWTERVGWADHRPLQVDEAEHVYAATRYDRRAIRGVKVAEAPSMGGGYTVVDMSPVAEAARRALAASMGVSADNAAYHLVRRPLEIDPS